MPEVPKSSVHRPEIVERFLARQPGESIRMIALSIGITKNTAIGVLSRDGLLNKRPKAMPPPRPTIPFPEPHTCMFGFGHPGQIDFHWCGAPSGRDTYCPEHHEKVYIVGSNTQVMSGSGAASAA
jgi:hypothetical protein